MLAAQLLLISTESKRAGGDSFVSGKEVRQQPEAEMHVENVLSRPQSICFALCYQHSIEPQKKRVGLDKAVAQ
jgi:hypothetical protein